MVDIHTHILPAVDDGSPDLENSLKMLRQAKESGTKAVVLTPHVNRFGDGRNLAPDIIKAFEEFKAKTIEENVGVDVFFGGEVYAAQNILELAANRLLPTINNTRYMLVEFNFHEKQYFINTTLRNLRDMGYLPIVAHPERYDCVKENFMSAFDMINSGGIIQLNKGSLTGAFGAASQNAAWDLVFRRMAHFVATDCHNLDTRNTEMDFVYNSIRSEINKNYADSLFDINPNTVLNNGIIMLPRPRV